MYNFVPNPRQNHEFFVPKIKRGVPKVDIKGLRIYKQKYFPIKKTGLPNMKVLPFLSGSPVLTSLLLFSREDI